MIHWKKIWCAALLLAALTGLAACGSHESAPAMSEDAFRQALVGKTWTLARIVNREFDVDPPMTLQFTADGKVAGFGGCNNFTGTYTLEGQEIAFGPMASTRKSCGPAQDEREYTFLTFLAKVRSADLEEDELKLSTENMSSMTFTSGSSGLLW
ncbi:META domain-containing protein [Pseudodesulfovibrio indicus]|uniref:META domain-containing protein n=1 Tax=Pseudodesulfovibrio indicus TaxID=1716143 RepID=UPI0029302EF0|nr:META domain-containing protein [Pseudodesulfovibrio indicus]